MWNGSPRVTAFVSATQLTASIYASDIAATGSAAVGVTSPGPGGGASNGVPLTIAAELPPSPAPQVTLTPSTLNFSAQTVGAASMPQAVTVQNTGNADLNRIAITLSGANSASFAQSTTWEERAGGSGCRASEKNSAYLASLKLTATYTVCGPTSVHVLPLRVSS